MNPAAPVTKIFSIMLRDNSSENGGLSPALLAVGGRFWEWEGQAGSAGAGVFGQISSLVVLSHVSVWNALYLLEITLND